MPLLPRPIPSIGEWLAEVNARAMVHFQPIQQATLGAIMAKKDDDKPARDDLVFDEAHGITEGTELDVTSFRDIGEVLRIIHGMDEFTPPTPEEIKQEMLRRKLEATSADELLAGTDATPLEDLFGEPIMIRDYHMVKAADHYDQAVFFVLDITHKADHRTVTTGALDVMETVAIAKARGFLPMMAVASRATVATANGFYPVKLRQFRADDEPF